MLFLFIACVYSYTLEIEVWPKTAEHTWYSAELPRDCYKYSVSIARDFVQTPAYVINDGYSITCADYCRYTLGSSFTPDLLDTVFLDLKEEAPISPDTALPATDEIPAVSLSVHLWVMINAMVSAVFVYIVIVMNIPV